MFSRICFNVSLLLEISIYIEAFFRQVFLKVAEDTDVLEDEHTRRTLEASYDGKSPSFHYHLAVYRLYQAIPYIN